MEIYSKLSSLLGLLTLLQTILPTQILSMLHSFFASLQDFSNPYAYFEIPEFHGCCGLEVNDLYRHVNLYINSINPSSTCRRLKLSSSRSSGGITFSVAPNHTVHDRFRDHLLSWTHHVDSFGEKRCFTLKLPNRHRAAILSPYLEHVTTRAQEFERSSRKRRLFTNNGPGPYDLGWASVPFQHPSTFETLALEPELRRQLQDDLRSFSEGKEFYKKIGRAWKRGYLLCGPPGSGKSSLIAAMANFLCYDVYDLELSKVLDNSELRALLIQATNRSVIVIEDIDCSVDLTGNRAAKAAAREMLVPEKCRRNANGLQNNRINVGDNVDENHGRVTLSGLLNFSDGLWSCCGEERIVVFTTNHKDRVDPALVRCGRMDVHVSLGTCGMHAFKALVKSYLGLDLDSSHACYDVVESCIRSGGGLTPAQIGEILLRNRRDADVAVKAVVDAMQAKIMVADVEDHDDDDDVSRTPERMPADSPESWEQWESSVQPEKRGGEKRKLVGSNNNGWERKVKLLVRLKA